MGSMPILYSFRRCPYAMRARTVLHRSGVRVELREVVLRDKPPELLEASRKGTVPVLVLPDGGVIDESRDIMAWALRLSDPEGWWPVAREEQVSVTRLLDENDAEFKFHLDRYKYPNRYPGAEPLASRAAAERFVRRLDELLRGHAFLLGNAITLADVGIFPFIRQFARTDPDWFQATPYPALRRWLDYFLRMPWFTDVMKKYPPWRAGQPPVYFPSDEDGGAMPYVSRGAGS